VSSVAGSKAETRTNRASRPSFRISRYKHINLYLAKRARFWF